MNGDISNGVDQENLSMNGDIGIVDEEKLPLTKVDQGKLPLTKVDQDNLIFMNGDINNRLNVNGVIKKINPSLLTPDDFIHINVCGTWYQPLRSTLARFPNTLLADEARMQEHYVEFMGAYYFDRHRDCFDSILYYYQSGGSLLRPTSVPMDLFIEEVRFFEIPEDVVKKLEMREGYVPLDESEEPAKDLPANKVQRCVWQFIEHPDSSMYARIVAIFSIFVILISIGAFCIETIPRYHRIILHNERIYDDRYHDNSTLDNNNNNNNNNNDNNNNNNGTTIVESVLLNNVEDETVVKMLKFIEMISVAWFTLEYFTRLFSSPHKWTFLKSWLNLIDFAAILPFFLTQAISSKSSGSPLAVIKVARLLRVFRVFKLSRHSKGLQVLGWALKSSINELAMITFLLSFGIIVFSSALYYAEYTEERVSTFESIPNTFWYALVTMTTVGYGDHIPRSILGKCLGGLAAIAGVLTVAMVVPVIDSNFDFFYKRDRLVQEQQQRTQPSPGDPPILIDGDRRLSKLSDGDRRHSKLTDLDVHRRPSRLLRRHSSNKLADRDVP